MYKHIHWPFLVKTLKPSEKKSGSIMRKEKYHENEPVECFCEDCKVCICHKCGVTVHNHNNKKDIQHATEGIKNQMEKVVQKIKAKPVNQNSLPIVTINVKKQEHLFGKIVEFLLRYASRLWILSWLLEFDAGQRFLTVIF